MKANQYLQKIKDNEDGFSNLVPMVLAIIIVFAIIFIGAYVNGVIHQQLRDNIGSTTGGAASGTPQGLARRIENDTRAGWNNSSTNWDSTLNIVQVVIIITILAAAIGAIFLFTRYRG